MKTFRVVQRIGIVVSTFAFQAAAWQDSRTPQINIPEWTVDGVISDSSNSARLTDARVTIRGTQGALVGTTDSSGRYSISGAAPGVYSVSAAKKGYGASAALPTYKTLSLAPGLKIGQVNLSLDPEGVIFGRVLDANKQPIAAAPVVAKIRVFTRGKVSYQTAAYAETNDRGEYRLTGLLPAAYFVAAVPPIDKPVERARSMQAPETQGSVRIGLVRGAYYPGVQSATAASAVRLHPAEERGPVDILFGNTEVHCLRASAPAVSRDGRLSLSLVELVEGRPQGVAAGALSGGSFEVCGLDRGAYELNLYVFASNNPSSRPASMAIVQFDVGREDVDLGVLRPQPQAAMSGKAELSGTKQGSDFPTGVTVRLMPQRRSIGIGEKLGPERVNGDGSFQFPATYPGDYDLTVAGLPAGFYVRTISQSGRDCAAVGVNPAAGPIRIDIATDGGFVSGRAVDAENSPVADAVILLIPLSGAQTTVASSDQGGGFTLSGSFPPGDYRLLAFTGVRPDEAQDLDLVRRYLGSATEITMGPGEVKALTVEVRRAAPAY